MPKTKDRIDSVMFLWEIEKVDKRYEWRLVGYYGCDDDGHGLPATVRTSSKAQRRSQVLELLAVAALAKDSRIGGYEKFLFEQDEEGENTRENMSRAVTCWSPRAGVRLIDYHPPAWARWLAPGFYDRDFLAEHWLTCLSGAYATLDQTVELALALYYTQNKGDFA